MIEFRGSLDQATYIRALRLGGASSRLLAIILLAGGVGMAAFVYRQSDGPMALVIPLLLIALGVYVLAAPVIAARRAFRHSVVLQASFSGYADEAMFVLESVHGRSNVRWEALHKAVLGADLVLLFTGPRLFFILSRGFFSDEGDWSEFRKLVQTSVAIGRPGRSALKAGILWCLIVVATFVGVVCCIQRVVEVNVQERPDGRACRRWAAPLADSEIVACGSKPVGFNRSASETRKASTTCYRIWRERDAHLMRRMTSTTGGLPSRTWLFSRPARSPQPLSLGMWLSCWRSSPIGSEMTGTMATRFTRRTWRSVVSRYLREISRRRNSSS